MIKNDVQVELDYARKNRGYSMDNETKKKLAKSIYIQIKALAGTVGE